MSIIARCLMEHYISCCNEASWNIYGLGMSLTPHLKIYAVEEILKIVSEIQLSMQK